MILLGIRLILTCLYLSIVATFGIILCLLRPSNPKNIRVIANVLWKGAYILGLKIKVYNEERLDTLPKVIVSNHQENMDVFVGARLIPESTVTIGKKSIIYIPFFGLFYYLSGNILIDRSNKKSAHGTMDYAAKQILQRKISVWILAEGTRSKGRGVLPFKKGAFVTAIKAQVPLQSVAISTYKNHINLKKWNAGTILVDISEPLETTGMTIENVEALRERSHSWVKTRVQELDLELSR